MELEHAKRLRLLADRLETVPPDQFDIDMWAGASPRPEPGKAPTVGDCGTVACAVGWATTVPELSRAGLRLAWCGVSAYPVYGGLTDGPAVAAFFGLSEQEEEQLFRGESYPPHREVTPLGVARRVRAFLAGEVLCG